MFIDRRKATRTKPRTFEPGSDYRGAWKWANECRQRRYTQGAVRPFTIRSLGLVNEAIEISGENRCILSRADAVNKLLARFERTHSGQPQPRVATRTLSTRLILRLCSARRLRGAWSNPLWRNPYLRTRRLDLWLACQRKRVWRRQSLKIF